MNFVSFIIPSINRPTLARALQSVIDQTDKDWNAVIVGDFVPNFFLPIGHDRFLVTNLSRKLGNGANGGGLVRSHGMSLASGLWFAFLDDDDRLDIHYAEWLREEATDADMVIFRMREGAGGRVLPANQRLEGGGVGISFAVRAQLQMDKGLWFPADPVEDWIFIQNTVTSGGRIKISERVAYYVRH